MSEAGLTFFMDLGDLWVVSPEGLAMFWSDGRWRPEGGSRAMALAVFGDERAIELTEGDAADVLERGGIPWPVFGDR